jgi:hypothetical protein
MPGPNRTTHEKDREEDYRDFEQRDLGEGWPYADGEPVKRRNADYGEASDELDPKNTQISREPFIESQGGPSLFPDEEHGTINDDDIEERISNRLSDSGRWSDNQIEITVHDGIAEINGEVDTEQDSQIINQLVLRTAGVRDTRNNLILLGADSHIPFDADE